jgi:hypothetical protein
MGRLVTEELKLSGVLWGGEESNGSISADTGTLTGSVVATGWLASICSFKFWKCYLSTECSLNLLNKVKVDELVCEEACW